MILSTAAQLLIASPYTVLSTVQPLEAVRQKAGLGEMTSWHIFHVRGLTAETLLSNAYGLTLQGVGSIVETQDGTLVRLRCDEFLLLTGNPSQAESRLSAMPSTGLITLTDITHGRAVMTLAGLRARDVLPKVCGLDFADAKFANHFAAQTSLAKVRTLIIRLDSADMPVFYLIVDRSLAAYVWDVVFDATQEFGGIVLNKDSLKSFKE